jgi:hypothetical protein
VEAQVLKKSDGLVRAQQVVAGVIAVLSVLVMIAMAVAGVLKSIAATRSKGIRVKVNGQETTVGPATEAEAAEAVEGLKTPPKNRKKADVVADVSAAVMNRKEDRATPPPVES